MEEQKNRIDDFFKRRLSDEEATLPSDGWNAIKSKLAAQQGGTTMPNNNRFGNKRIILAMCLLLLSLGTTVWYAVKLKSENKVLASKLNSQNNQAGENNLNTKSATALAKTDFEKKQLPDVKKTKYPSSNLENLITDLNTFSKSKKHSDLLKLNSKKIATKTIQANNSKHKGNINRIEKSTYNNQKNTKNSNHNFVHLQANTGQQKSLKNKSMNSKIKDNHYSVMSKLPIIKNKNQSKIPAKQNLKKDIAGVIILNESLNANSSTLAANTALVDPPQINIDTFKLTNDAKINSIKPTVIDTTLELVKTETTAAIETKNQSKKKKSLLGGMGVALEYFIAPDLAYNSVAYSGTPISKAAQEYKKNDQNRTGFSSGLLLNLQVSKKFYLQTGFIYSNAGNKNNSNYQWKSADTTLVGYKINTNTLDSSKWTTLSPDVQFIYQSISQNNWQNIPSPTLLNSTSMSDSSVSNRYVVTQNYQKDFSDGSQLQYQIKINEYVNNLNQRVKNSINYFGIPVVIGTRLALSDRISFGIFSGVITNILLSPSKINAYSYQESEYSSKITVKEIALNKLNFVYWGGVDICYQLNKQWAIRLAPVVKHSLNSIYKDEAILRQVPYSYGIQLGVKYIIRDIF